MPKDKKKVSEYYLKELNVPEDIIKKWDEIGYVEKGVINFKKMNFLVDGFWNKKEPYFDTELEKTIKEILFMNNPKYSIYACKFGMVCEVREDNSIMEFEVRDTEKDEPIFQGIALGICITKNNYLDCIFTDVYLKPILKS
jgi:hypothetical protein